MQSRVTTLIFDVDDTLYDVSTGFTSYRNGEAVQIFMMEYLHFPDMESARIVRDEYFERYHATAKALNMAEIEGRFPPVPSVNLQQPAIPRFRTEQLSEYWATHMNYGLLGGPKIGLAKDLEDCKLQLVAFSNAPRTYIKRVLQELGLFHIFGEDRLFAVEDVLPHCKPERAAFETVFKRLGCRPEETIMVEDSMKNIRQAKELGLKTILITGTGRFLLPGWHPSNPRSRTTPITSNSDVIPLVMSSADGDKAVELGDSPIPDDPAVDIAIERVEQLRCTLPSLWEQPPFFVK